MNITFNIFCKALRAIYDPTFLPLLPSKSRLNLNEANKRKKKPKASYVL